VGSYEVQVGIDGEFTQERKTAKLDEIKRISEEEYSDMIFTVDDVQLDCEEEEKKYSRLYKTAIDNRLIFITSKFCSLIVKN